MRCEEALGLITALVDEELVAQDRHSIESHLKDCPKCRFVYAEEQILKREVRLAAATVKAPADLRERVLSDRRIFPKRTDLLEGWKELFWPTKLLFRPAFVLALLLLLILPTLYFIGPGRESVSLATLQLHQGIVAGSVPFARAGSEEELKERLVRSVAGRFDPMGFDLSAMGLFPVGGLVEELGGKKVLVVVYQGNDLSLTCFTFLGTEKDAPSAAGIFFDPEKKMNFYSFSSGRINAIMHREGEVICILASEMPMQDLLALARSKAQAS
jgi:anti-sigma factor (TIGR02949 family)